MNPIDISVVMAEYNTKPEYLVQAISSILNQTINNFELIIVDDCGNNDVNKIVKTFDDNRIRIIQNPKNMGFVYSLNVGAKNAMGKYIVRMDTDDIATPNRIQELYNFIKNNTEYSVVSSRALEFTGDTEIGIIGKKGEKTAIHVMRGDVPVHAAAIVKKDALEEIGGYKFGYTRAEDLVLWCDLLLEGHRLFMLNDVLYKYRVNPNDYKKRTLRKRGGEIKARMYYYPKLGAGPIEYFRILKSICAGALPIPIVRFYRNNIILSKVGK